MANASGSITPRGPPALGRSHPAGSARARRRADAPGGGGGHPILLARPQGHVYAVGETCSYLGGPLSAGTLEEGTVRCPWHGSCFALEAGRVVDGPATYPQPCFETRMQHGQIELRTPSDRA
jgi:nitrite reductase/ring-hydroxylating ferredoxin subunit